jgi:2-polyprenyl-3-methyl-5-hydroxy-6-metoxy-1,4-benzoquinol methylase
MATGSKMTSKEQVSTEKREQFAGKMIATVNSAGLSMMISIGHRTGLFDRMAEMDWATSDQIAAHASLQERYVREWLGAMVTGGVVEYDPKNKTYHLPPEHASWLTRGAAPDNLAVTTQWISVLGRVEDRIVETFREGGGVAYEEFHRFHEVMREESAQTVVATLLEYILPMVPGLNGRLDEGIRVLDVGCGGGRALMRMAETFPVSQFTGFDLCEDAVEMARKEACERGLQNVQFERRDVSKLQEPESLDLITAFDAIHDQADPAGVLRGIHRALKPDGVFLMQDIDSSSQLHKNMENPIGTFLYTISCMHCMTVSLAQGGAGLGTCWGVELAQRMLTEAGFSHVDTQRLEHDIFNCYFVIQK